MSNALVSFFIALGVGAGFSYVFSIVSQQFKTVAWLTRLLGEQYGFVRRKYEIDYDIRPDGSAHTVHMEEFKAINAELSGVEHYSGIVTEPASIQERFRLETKSGKSNRSDVKITAKTTLVTPTRLHYQLLFSPAIRPGQTIEYSYEVDGPPGMYMTSEEEVLARNLPYDYISMKIGYPTEHLSMRVVFPPQIHIDRLAFDVWMGDARLRLKKEFARLESAGALKQERLGGNLVVHFVVDYPILDLKYAITWMPMKADV